jgi:LmbE family N-acetylglucosaminyl deacetylase
LPLEDLEPGPTCLVKTLLPAGSAQRLHVLCVGAHCDDIEIGCAGALLQLQKSFRGATFDWVVLSGTADRQRETRNAMRLLLQRARRGKLLFGNFPDASLPGSYGELKAFFAGLRKLRRPDVVFCHERGDAHQDHRMVNEMVWGAFRDHVILEYEIPKWDGGLTTPNVYVPLTAAQMKRKVSILAKAFGSQRSRDWFTSQTFEGLMRLRGVECRARSGYAEGFFARKLTLLGS